MRLTSSVDINGLTQMVVGSAYDNVQKVAQNIDSINEVLDSNTTWLGALDQFPTTNAVGDPILEGSVMYHKIIKSIYIRINGGWEDIITAKVLEHLVAVNNEITALKGADTANEYVVGALATRVEALENA